MAPTTALLCGEPNANMALIGNAAVTTSWSLTGNKTGTDISLHRSNVTVQHGYGKLLHRLENQNYRVRLGSLNSKLGDDKDDYHRSDAYPIFVMGFEQ